MPEEELGDEVGVSRPPWADGDSGYPEVEEEATVTRPPWDGEGYPDVEEAYPEVTEMETETVTVTDKGKLKCRCAGVRRIAKTDSS